MNPDGTWFGIVSEWFSVHPGEGTEAVIEPLLAQQRDLTRARETRLIAELAHKPPAARPGVPAHARVLDVARGRWVPDQTVIVVGDKITAVEAGRVGSATRRIAEIGRPRRPKALVPGMVDMHAHLGDTDGVLDIASGVTTARDVGNDPVKLDAYQASFDKGTSVGPHVIRFGFIEGRNEKAASSKVTARDPRGGQGRRQVLRRSPLRRHPDLQLDAARAGCPVIAAARAPGRAPGHRPHPRPYARQRGRARRLRRHRAHQHAVPQLLRDPRDRYARHHAVHAGRRKSEGLRSTEAARRCAIS